MTTEDTHLDGNGESNRERNTTVGESSPGADPTRGESESNEGTAWASNPDRDPASGESASVSTAEPVLVAEGVSHAYGGLSVLESVSVRLRPGQVVALVGPNGSGKTTLVRVLAGLLSPSEGEVSYRGPDRQRERGYLPQQPAFRPGFTARETLAFYTSLVGGDPDAPLSRVGLSGAADRSVEGLSGGMTRLLGIAQATVGDPPVVLFDEPGSGLDPGMRRQTWAAVGELAAGDTAVLLSTHDTRLAAEFADRVLLLGDGELLADGSPGALTAEHGCDSLGAVYETVIPDEAGPVGRMGESG